MHKKTSRDKNSNRSSVALSKRNTWNQRRDVLANEKWLQLIKVITPSVIDNMS